MNKKDIVNTLKNSNLDLQKIWLLCGTAMVMHGAKNETGDIDLGCSIEYFKQIESIYPNIKIWPDGMRSIFVSNEIEIFENWNINKSIVIEGVIVSSIDDIITHKLSLNRSKDKIDLELLYTLKLEKNKSL